MPARRFTKQTKRRALAAGCAAVAAMATAAAGAAVPTGSAGAAAKAADAASRQVRLHRAASATSTNWAGYTASGGGWTQVSAGWRQPAARCSAGDGVSSFWVGLDGVSSGTVEQIGTDTDCAAGLPSVYGWYELYPGPPVDFAAPVRAGDHMWASVTAGAGRSFTLRLVDITRGWSRTEHRRLGAARLSSAEVIAEAPSSSSGSVQPLADFGAVTFLGATADGRSLGSAGPQRLTMASRGGTVKARTSPLDGGRQFTVTWYHH